MLREAAQLAKRAEGSSGDGYADYRESQRQLMSEKSAAGRDIGTIPPPCDPERRARCKDNLQLFIETYLVKLFAIKGVHWPWSKTQLLVMRHIEETVRLGTKFAVAMERGGGKTSLLKAGVLWATFYGYRRWGCLIAATAPKAKLIVHDLQTIIETNELFGDERWRPEQERQYMGDFPEICYPIHRLERIVNRQRGQTCEGSPTRMTWNSDEIVFPQIPDSACAGSIITCSGMDGAGIRGQVRVMPDGTQLRPDLVFLDDVQTDEVAKSEFQTAECLNLMGGAVLEMGPPGVPLAALMAATVIRGGDVADTVLNNPEWNGVRSPMLVKFPLHRSATPADVPHKDWWDQYAEQLSSGHVKEATALYAAHRCLPECEPLLDEPRPCSTCPIAETCMDNGAIVSWRYRKFPDDLSAIQHAMDRHIRNPALFAAEMQQSPLAAELGGIRITAEQVAQRVTGLARGMVPPNASLITAAVDVHNEVLYWVVVAWELDFTGQVINYGTYPEQPTRWFRQAAPPRPMSSIHTGKSAEGVIVAGLESLCGIMLNHEFVKEAGGTKTVYQIEKLLVDAAYFPTSIEMVRRKLATPIMQSSRGLPKTAANKPISAYERKKGWRFGDDWYIPSVRGTREFPYVGIDTNAWKTRAHRALLALPGSRGALTLYGTPATITDHEPFATQIAESQFSVETFANGRTVFVYKDMPGGPGTHWWDALVMCFVGASMMGCKPPVVVQRAQEEKKAAKAKRRFLTLNEMAGSAR